MTKEAEKDPKAGKGLTCPNCGQFLGPSNVCPYCRTKVKGRLDIRSIKAISLFIAVVGVALLLVWANMKGVTKRDIGDITKRQNYAYMEIEGVIKGDVRYHIQVSDDGKALPGSLEFQIDDGTGILAVKAYDEVTKDLVKKNMIPIKGDRVKVAGSANFRENDVSLVIQDPEELEIDRDPSDINITISDIWKGRSDPAAFENGKEIKIQGKLYPLEHQEDKLGVGFQDLYQNARLVVHDDQDIRALIQIPHSLIGAYGDRYEERESGELSIKDENVENRDLTVEGRLIWDKYAPVPGDQYERGNWVIVPFSLEHVKIIED